MECRYSPRTLAVISTVMTLSLFIVCLWIRHTQVPWPAVLLVLLIWPVLYWLLSIAFMDPLSIKCAHCKTLYTLGVNAAVSTWGGVMSDFASHGSAATALRGPGSPGGIDGTEDTPDLVVELPTIRFAEPDPIAAAAQEADLTRIAAQIASGMSRWWRCQACQHVQVYRRERV